MAIFVTTLLDLKEYYARAPPATHFVLSSEFSSRLSLGFFCFLYATRWWSSKIVGCHSRYKLLYFLVFRRLTIWPNASLFWVSQYNEALERWDKSSNCKMLCEFLYVHCWFAIEKNWYVRFVPKPTEDSFCVKWENHLHQYFLLDLNLNTSLVPYMMMFLAKLYNIWKKLYACRIYARSYDNRGKELICFWTERVFLQVLMTSDTFHG